MEVYGDGNMHISSYDGGKGSCPDVNGDYKIDSIDLGIVYDSLGSNNLVCDLNGDNKVNYHDLGLEFGYYLGWQTRHYTYVPPAIEKTATAFRQAINQIRQKYP
ncbi:MAG: hypothetical protein QW270_08495 [Candidatus Bathyarchaeia archaeon]